MSRMYNSTYLFQGKSNNAKVNLPLVIKAVASCQLIVFMLLT